MSKKNFLPVSKADLEEMGIKQLDFIMITGDAYVDHPSFGAALIARLLESRGYSIGIIAQPDWRSKESFRVLGIPRLAFLVTSGNMDSMVSNYTVSGRKRKNDMFSPGNKTGMRPDRAVIVYTNRIRDACGDVPVIIGGMEASLRRLAHYDYWEDRVRRSILLDSKADLLVYGMGEKPILEIAEALDAGIDIKHLSYIPQTAYVTSDIDDSCDHIKLEDYTKASNDKEAYARNFMIQYENSSPFDSRTLVERYADKTFVVQNPPASPLDQMDLDDIYELPYTKLEHPSYSSSGGIKALEEVRFSLLSSRGCFGGCSFCALTNHQGRIVSARSHGSIIREAVQLTKEPDFKGYIHDVGGPTANFRFPSCQKQSEKGVCSKRQCLFPKPCPELRIDHSDYVALLRRLRDIDGIKKVFIRSGIRYDYLLYDKDKTFLNELCRFHISGQLKVAPEHICDDVLNCMSKPSIKLFEEFKRIFKKENEKLGRKQYLVPYFMSSHPGATLDHAIDMAEYFHKNDIRVEQAQDFYPTPGTLSTCMYYTGLDPRNMKKVYVAKKPGEKAMQRALIQYYKPGNHKLVVEALKITGRKSSIIKTRKQ